MPTKALKNKRLDIYKHSDEIIFLMEFLKASYISCKKIYPSHEEYNLFLSCGRASEIVSQKEFDRIIQKAKAFRKKFFAFVQIQPSDTQKYRSLMRDFMKKSGIKPTKFSDVNFKTCRFTTIESCYKHLLDMRLKVEDLFLDNNIDS